MGFFSFNTADTKESIPAAASGLLTKAVYLIQPNNKPIKEDCYMGSGCFGGVDIFDWLAEKNLPKECIKKWKGELRDLGIEIHATDSDFFLDKKNKAYACGEAAIYLARQLCNVKAKRFNDYGSLIIIDGIESSVHKHLESGRLINKSFEDFVKNPIKLSFNENACYEELDCSTDCVFQGYFYPTE